MDKKKLILIIAGILVLALLISGIVLLTKKLSGNRDGDNTKRGNILRLASDYYSQGEYQRALDLLDQLLIENPDDKEAKTLRDEIIEAKKDREEEERQRELDDLKAQNEELKQGFNQLSASMNQETPEEKAARLKREEDERRRKAEIDLQVEELVNEGRKALKKGDFDTAIDYARQALKLKPDSLEAKKLKADAEKAREDAETESERKAREARERQITQLLQDADKALNDGRYGDAIKKANEVLALDPDNGRAYAIIGEAEYRQNPDNKRSRDTAEQNFNRAVNLDPENWKSYFFLGLSPMRTRITRTRSDSSTKPHR